MRVRARMAAWSVCAALAMGTSVFPTAGGGTRAAYAQNFGQRVIIGVVQNGNGDVVAGATVFLRSAKNKSIRSYTTAADGHFRFAQVNMPEDFDLWAEKDGKKSPIKAVSSWDTRKEMAVELRIK